MGTPKTTAARKVFTTLLNSHNYSSPGRELQFSIGAVALVLVFIVVLGLAFPHQSASQEVRPEDFDSGVPYPKETDVPFTVATLENGRAEVIPEESVALPNFIMEGMTVPRIIIGMWQVSGAHGYIDRAKAVAEMNEYAEAGFTAFDMADIYGPAEEIFGDFRRSREEEDLAILGFTKFVPRPGPMARSLVEKSIERSRLRMKVPTLDMVQFHWWDYSDHSYMHAMSTLASLQASGMIRALSLTNFDTKRMKEFGDAGIKLASNQVSYSLIDWRPESHMVPYCIERGIHLLTYGNSQSN
eukprot:gene23893-28990_t